MGKKAVTILPATKQILETMGEQIKLARLRRSLSTALVAERADISRLLCRCAARIKQYGQRPASGCQR